MKKLIFLIFLVTTVLVSCDGRYRSYESPVDALLKNNQLQAFSEKINFIPNTYTQITTDTILSNNLRIKIKYHSIDTNTLKLSTTLKEVKTTNYYTNFEALYEISTKNKMLKKGKINKSLFHHLENDNFWNRAIMQHVWVDYNTIIKYGVNLNVSFCIPESTICKDFTIFIDKNGAFETKSINLLKTLL